MVSDGERVLVGIRTFYSSSKGEKTSNVNVSNDQVYYYAILKQIEFLNILSGNVFKPISLDHQSILL